MRINVLNAVISFQQKPVIWTVNNFNELVLSFCCLKLSAELQSGNERNVLAGLYRCRQDHIFISLSADQACHFGGNAMLDR
jgi:hypothetical protein